MLKTLREHGLGVMTHVIGKTRPPASEIDAGKGELQVWRDAKAQFQCQAGRPAPGVGCRELEDLPSSATTRPVPIRNTLLRATETDPGMHVYMPNTAASPRGICAGSY